MNNTATNTMVENTNTENTVQKPEKKNDGCLLLGLALPFIIAGMLHVAYLGLNWLCQYMDTLPHTMAHIPVALYIFYFLALISAVICRIGTFAILAYGAICIIGLPFGLMFGGIACLSVKLLDIAGGFNNNNKNKNKNETENKK